MNVNIPPIPILVINKFLDNTKGFTPAHLISVRALYGQALQFSVILENGALFTGLPSNSIVFKENKAICLNESQMYDCIGDDIQCFVMETLRYAECTVKTTKNNIIRGKYLFTIDFIGKSGLSYHPEQWKQFHCVESDCGNLFIYPQYRLRFLDKGLCPRQDVKMPNYLANKNHWIIGS